MSLINVNYKPGELVNISRSEVSAASPEANKVYSLAISSLEALAAGKASQTLKDCFSSVEVDFSPDVVNELVEIAVAHLSHANEEESAQDRLLLDHIQACFGDQIAWKDVGNESIRVRALIQKLQRSNKKQVVKELLKILEASPIENPQALDEILTRLHQLNPGQGRACLRVIPEAQEKHRLSLLCEWLKDPVFAKSSLKKSSLEKLGIKTAESHEVFLKTVLAGPGSAQEQAAFLLEGLQATGPRKAEALLEIAKQLQKGTAVLSPVAQGKWVAWSVIGLTQEERLGVGMKLLECAPRLLAGAFSSLGLNDQNAIEMLAKSLKDSQPELLLGMWSEISFLGEKPEWRDFVLSATEYSPLWYEDMEFLGLGEADQQARTELFLNILAKDVEYASQMSVYAPSPPEPVGLFYTLATESLEKDHQELLASWEEAIDSYTPKLKPIFLKAVTLSMSGLSELDRGHPSYDGALSRARQRLLRVAQVASFIALVNPQGKDLDRLAAPIEDLLGLPRGQTKDLLVKQMLDGMRRSEDLFQEASPLLALPFVALRKAGASDDALQQLYQETEKLLSKGKDAVLSDTKRQVLSRLTQIAESTDLTVDHKVALIELLLDATQTVKENAANLGVATALLRLGYGEAMTRIHSQKDLEILYAEAWKKLLPLQPREDFSEKFQAAFATLRSSRAVEQYLDAIIQLPEEEAAEMKVALASFIDSVLSKTFFADRYDSSNSAHLATIWEEYPDLAKAWSVGAIPSFSLEPRGVFENVDWAAVSAAMEGTLPSLIGLANKEKPNDLFPAALKRAKASQAFKLKTKDINSKNFTEQQAFDRIETLLLQALRSSSRVEAINRLQTCIEWLEPMSQSYQSLSPLLAVLSQVYKEARESKPLLPEGYQLVDTDHWWDLFLSGVEARDSCLDVTGRPEKNKALLGYVLNGKNRMLAIKDSNGRVVARRMIRLLRRKEDGVPVLFLERFYQNSDNPELDALLIRLAKNKAEECGVDLYWSEGGEETGVLESLADRAPWDYLDQTGDVCPREGYEVPLSQKVS